MPPRLISTGYLIRKRIIAFREIGASLANRGTSHPHERAGECSARAISVVDMGTLQQEGKGTDEAPVTRDRVATRSKRPSSLGTDAIGGLGIQGSGTPYPFGRNVTSGKSER